MDKSPREIINWEFRDFEHTFGYFSSEKYENRHFHEVTSYTHEVTKIGGRDIRGTE